MIRRRAVRPSRSWSRFGGFGERSRRWAPHGRAGQKIFRRTGMVASNLIISLRWCRTSASGVCSWGAGRQSWGRLLPDRFQARKSAMLAFSRTNETVRCRRLSCRSRLRNSSPKAALHSGTRRDGNLAGSGQEVSALHHTISGHAVIRDHPVSAALLPFPRRSCRAGRTCR